MGCRHDKPNCRRRDDRGRGSACAKAVDASTSRGVGTSVTARTPNACVWSGAGRRRSGRPNGVRTMRPKPSTPRPNVRAVSAPHLRPNPRRLPRLRRRVVTQQKFFRRLPCAIGRGAMNRPRSRAATRHATAAPPAVRRFAGCWIANASGSARGTFRGRRAREQEYQAARARRRARATRHRQRDATTGAAFVTSAHRPRRSAVDGLARQAA